MNPKNFVRQMTRLDIAMLSSLIAAMLVVLVMACIAQSPITHRSMPPVCPPSYSLSSKNVCVDENVDSQHHTTTVAGVSRLPVDPKVAPAPGLPPVTLNHNLASNITKVIDLRILNRAGLKGPVRYNVIFVSQLQYQNLIESTFNVKGDIYPAYAFVLLTKVSYDSIFRLIPDSSKFNASYETIMTPEITQPLQ